VYLCAEPPVQADKRKSWEYIGSVKQLKFNTASFLSNLSNVAGLNSGTKVREMKGK